MAVSVRALVDLMGAAHENEAHRLAYRVGGVHLVSSKEGRVDGAR